MAIIVKNVDFILESVQLYISVSKDNFLKISEFCLLIINLFILLTIFFEGWDWRRNDTGIIQ